MRTVKFIKDFAAKKQGESWKCDSQLASQLVRNDKVAVYDDEAPKADKPAKASEGAKAKKRAPKKEEPKAVEKSEEKPTESKEKPSDK